MKIKEKLFSFYFIIFFSFLLIIAVFFISFNILHYFKNVELQSDELIIKWKELQASNKDIIFSSESLDALLQKNQDAVNNFNEIIKNFNQNKKSFFLNFSILEEFKNMNNFWKIIKNDIENSYSVLKDIAEIQKTDNFQKGESLNVINTLSNINAAKRVNQVLLFNINRLQEINNELEFSTVPFNKILFEIKQQIKDSLDSFTKIIVFFISIFSLIVFGIAFIIIFLFSKGLSTKIKNVENNVKKLSEKDFTIKIDIPGKDELSSLGINLTITIKI